MGKTILEIISSLATTFGFLCVCGLVFAECLVRVGYQNNYVTGILISSSIYLVTRIINLAWEGTNESKS
jgi:hypothetical protein